LADAADAPLREEQVLSSVGFREKGEGIGVEDQSDQGGWEVEIARCIFSVA